MLSDSFGRIHNYLRISVTDTCNLGCLYCMPDGENHVTSKKNLMSADEIERTAYVFTSLGINKIRLTGGEPLFRKDIRTIIQKLSGLPAELSISTNAFFADRYIEDFKRADMKSVNVSLDSLKKEEFNFLTKRDHFSKILSNIYLLLENGFNVKVNIVVLKGINDHSITDFIGWTKDHHLEVRFIEFMPFDGNHWNIEKVFSYKNILELIETNYSFHKIQDSFNDTSRKYRADGHLGTFGIISTITDPFCTGCNRLRLTSDGKLKNCLFSADETDLLTPLRNGNDIIPLIHSTLKLKKEERGGQFETGNFINRSMVRIGG
ncbi:MAG TPA: GTP 3',8-cyclase MoaA [Ignavibacteria bacterium]|nr:GTP 3',8-cyclase MoaA [Ignavibacteria bacterium]